MLISWIKNFMENRVVAMRAVVTLVLLCVGVLSPRAAVRWLETEYNFGAFDEDDGKVSTRFRFVNDGSEPVQIEHVRSSCGCTVPEYSRSPIAPGETASITAVYNPTGRPGRFSKSLLVKLTDGTSQKLLIEGVVIGAQNTVRSRFPIEAGPVRLRGNLLTFGTVSPGHIKAEYTEIYNTSHDTIRPTWSDVPKYLRITAAQEGVPPGEQGTYSLVFAPTAGTPYGIVTDSLTLNIPGTDPVKVEFVAIVEEDFSKYTEQQLADAPKIVVEPSKVDFGQFSTSEGPITRNFTVTNQGKNPLLLRRIYTTEKGFTVKAKFDKLKKGKSGQVTVTFDPSGFTSPSPMLNGRLQVITNDPAHSQYTVRLVGFPQK